MTRFLVLLVMVVLLVVGWLFAAANSVELNVNYLFGTLSLRSSYWLLILFLLGFVTGVLYCGLALVKARLANRRLRDAFAKQESELQKMAAQLARHNGR